MNPNTLSRWLPVIALLFILWWTRVIALDVLPLHNDEGLHLTRAVEVWNGHPFWAISDGKIINHWLIAALYPQNAPVFVGRIATVLLAMIGLAAGYGLVRRLFGDMSSFLSSCLWITAPYLFFYERLALSDAEVGTLVVLTLWASLRLARSGRRRDAVLAGITLVSAMLFKFTAAPFTLMVAIVVLLIGKIPWKQRLGNLVIIGAVVFISFLPPVIYLFLRGRDFFSIALDWLGGASGASVGATGRVIGSTFWDNLARLWAQLTGFGIPLWTVFLLAGLFLLLIFGRSKGRILLLAWGVPLLVIMILGREVLPRHFVVALPLALILAGAGLGTTIKRLLPMSFSSPARVGVPALVLLLLTFAPFAYSAYRSPGDLPLPDEERRQYIAEHSGGFGLREAVQAFSQIIVRVDIPIIASMFPDSCKRANFYATSGYTILCPQLPGRAEIETTLAQQGAVYVLVDTAPIIGLDVTTLEATATRLAAYPRPGESDETASIVLWLLERQTTTDEQPTACSTDGVNTVLAPYIPSSLTEFVGIRDGQFVVGETRYLVRGVNYYPSRYPWRRFLTESNLDEVRGELDLLRDTGFNTLRLFLWNDALFVCPRDSAVPASDAFMRLDAIIQEAAARDLRLIITLNDLPDLDVHLLYTNPAHLQEQTRFIVERYRDEAAIMAWDLRNEGDIDYGTHPAFPARFAPAFVLDWLSQTSNSVRSLDSRHLITAGWLNNSETTAPSVDFVSFHHWGTADELRQRIIALRSSTDKPILLEEFGYSTFNSTPEEQAARIQLVFEMAESENLMGWMIWTAFDFPLDATCIRPACPSEDNAQHHYGLWNSDYTPKPAVALIEALMGN
jgi:hypothetical protein